MIARKIWGKKAVRPYVPDFTSAFDHICIHTGGRGVIDEIEKHLQLNSKLIEPSRAALYRSADGLSRGHGGWGGVGA
jgi:3-ketoacyl-CoA synthase